MLFQSWTIEDLDVAPAVFDQAELLVHGMMVIARCGLRHLRQQRMGMTQQQVLQWAERHRCRFQVGLRTCEVRRRQSA